MLNRAGEIITRAVGTMVCAIAFACLALVSLPDAIRNGRPAIISWVAQTFLQLVLLSIIMVGQQVQGARVEARDAETHDTVMAAFDELHEVLDELRQIEDEIDDLDEDSTP